VTSPFSSFRRRAGLTPSGSCVATGCRMPAAEQITIEDGGRSESFLACSEHYFDYCWGQLEPQLHAVRLSA